MAQGLRVVSLVFQLCAAVHGLSLYPPPPCFYFVYSILAEAHVLPYSKSRVSFGQLGNEFIPFIRKRPRAELHWWHKVYVCVGRNTTCGFEIRNGDTEC